MSSIPSRGGKPAANAKPPYHELIRAIGELQTTIRGLPQSLGEVFTRRAASGPSDAAGSPQGQQGPSRASPSDATDLLHDAFDKLPSRLAAVFKSSRSPDGASLLFRDPETGRFQSARQALGSGHRDYLKGWSAASRASAAARGQPPETSPYDQPLAPFIPLSAVDDKIKRSRRKTASLSHQDRDDDADAQAFKPLKPVRPAKVDLSEVALSYQDQIDDAIDQVFKPLKPTKSVNPFVGPPAPPDPGEFVGPPDLNSFVGPPAPTPATPKGSNPWQFSAFGTPPKSSATWPFSAFGAPPPGSPWITPNQPSGTSGGWQYGAFGRHVPPPFVGPPAPPPPGPPQPQGPANPQRNRPDAPFFATGHRAFVGGVARGEDGVREFKHRVDLEIGRVVGRDTVAAFGKANRAIGAFVAITRHIIKPFSDSIDFAEAANNNNRRFQAFNPAISMGFSRLAMGDMQRNRDEGRANEKAIVTLTASINAMRQAFLPYDTARTGVMTRLGTTSAEMGKIIGRDVVGPVADWVNRRLEANDPDGNWGARQINKPQAGAAWLLGLAFSGGSMDAANLAYQAIMAKVGGKLPDDNAWGQSIWEMKNPPLPLNPPIKRRRKNP